MVFHKLKLILFYRQRHHHDVRCGRPELDVVRGMLDSSIMSLSRTHHWQRLINLCILVGEIQFTRRIYLQ